MKETEKRIYFYKAGCGDAARIKYLGNDGIYHNIFIDSGKRKTFMNHIASHIKEMESNGENIDLWVISHIHDDHIGGVEQYIRQIKNGRSTDIVKDWLYNSPRKNIKIVKEVSGRVSAAKSIRQGDLLAQYLHVKDALPKRDIVSKLESLDFYGLKLDILSPSSGKLKSLRNKYESDPELSLERQEGEKISGAKSIIHDDYHIKLKDFDLSKWKEDTSIENGSSISILTEYNDIRILWLADSHPSDIVISLQRLGYSKSNKIACEWVKVSHHGSKGNNSDELYNLIDCKNYLFSANGKNRHKLPTKESIARILRNKQRNINVKYNLCFTDDNNILRSIFSEEHANIYKELNFKVEFLNDSSQYEYEY